MSCAVGELYEPTEGQSTGLVSDAEIYARARAINLEATRRSVKREARSELDSLQARLSDEFILYSSTTSPAQVLGTGPGDMLPPTCVPLVTVEPPDYEAAARCFVDGHPSLLLDGPDEHRGSAPDLVMIGNEPGGLAQPPEQYLRFEQHHRGHPVDGRSMALVFVDRRLATVSGRYAGTAHFRDPNADEASLETQARALFGADIELGRLAYNPTSGELELSIREGLHEHRINAADGAHRSTRPIGHALEVNKNINVYQFPPSVYLGTGSTTSLSSSPVKCLNGSPGTCDVGGSGTCLYLPSQVGVADRVGSVRVTYTPVPPNPPNEVQVYQDRPCGSTNVFTQSPWSSQYYLEHYAASARRNLDELADIMLHSESFFWVYPRTPSTDLMLNANATMPPNKAGEYTPRYWSNGPKINLKQDPTPNGSSYARHLDTIAHEYGHYWHDTYGYQGPLALLEGWADHFPLRVAIHKRFVTGAWSGLGYYTQISHERGHRIQRALLKGEWVADQFPPATDPAWLSYPNAYCPDSYYFCGALVGITYWLLSFDTCRINYNGCSNGTDIIQYNGGYNNSAWRLANSAYGYAIANAVSSTDIGAFHALVGTRYAQFQTAGYISVADRNRVYAALGAHCLGPTNVCPGKHRLPGSTLPSAYTEKHTLFKEAEWGQWAYGATDVTSQNQASGDKFVSLGTGGWLYIYFNIPEAGTYRIHFVTRATDGYWDKVRVFDPVTLTWRTVGPLGTTPTPFTPEWRWRTMTNGNADFTFTSAGEKWVYFSALPGQWGFVVDAIWLEQL